VFTSEAKMLETLLSLTTEQRFIAREGETLAVLASIEVARLAAEGRRFEYMARELAEFSAMVSSGAGFRHGRRPPYERVQTAFSPTSLDIKEKACM
jgi:hypothetical protein